MGDFGLDHPTFRRTVTTYECASPWGVWDGPVLLAHCGTEEEALRLVKFLADRVLTGEEREAHKVRCKRGLYMWRRKR